MLSKRQSCFDPQKKKWEVKATTSTRYQESTRLIVVKRKLYIAGGKVRGSPMAEYCNGKTNSWSVVKQKRIPANNLNAMNTKERVYFIINNFPIDSGIRTTDGRLNSAVLNKWENLRKIDYNAALGYMVMKRENGG